MTYTLPAYAADRYKLVVNQTGKRAEIGIYDKSGFCNLLAGGDCNSLNIPATIERLVRVADSRRDPDDPIAIAATIALAAEQLAQIKDHEGSRAEAFDGDWSSVYKHLEATLDHFADVINAGSEVAANMGQDLDSQAWTASADYAESSIRHLVNTSSMIGSAAAHALAGQDEMRQGARA